MVQLLKSRSFIVTVMIGNIFSCFLLFQSESQFFIFCICLFAPNIIQASASSINLCVSVLWLDVLCYMRSGEGAAVVVICIRSIIE